MMSKCHCSHEHSQVRRLTIHSQYTCAIEGSLRVHVPVRLYELTLKHRLLDQLGGFSHLILEALDVMPDRGIEWVLERTALNPQQLHPIVRRLEGLGLVENFNLTARAKPLLKAKRLLHSQTKYLWLDGDYRRHSFCGVHTLETSELNDETEFVIRPWHRGEGKPRLWPSGDWGEDCERQKNRIWDVPEQYLPVAFESFNECFRDQKFVRSDWALSVWVAAEISRDVRAIEVELRTDSLRHARTNDFTFASPVICLSTRFNMPEGAPEHLSSLLPANHCRFTTFVDNDDESVGELELTDDPKASWVWPVVERATKDRVIEHLFQELALAEENVSSVFNRHHALEERWQHLGFNWAMIQESLNLDGVYPIEDDQ